MFCAHDYALHALNRAEIIECFTFLSSTASFPRQLGLGLKVNLKCQREVKLQLGSLNRRSALHFWAGFQLEYQECLVALAPPWSILHEAVLEL